MEGSTSAESGTEGKITAMAVVNLILATVCLCAAGVAGLGLFYGLFFSGDTGEELFGGVVALLLTGSPFIIGLVVYGLAGVLLIQRRKMGFYLHVVGGVLAAFSCVGIIYTVIALVISTQDDFQRPFFGEKPPAV